MFIDWMSSTKVSSVISSMISSMETATGMMAVHTIFLMPNATSTRLQPSDHLRPSRTTSFLILAKRASKSCSSPHGLISKLHNERWLASFLAKRARAAAFASSSFFSFPALSLAAIACRLLAGAAAESSSSSSSSSSPKPRSISSSDSSLFVAAGVEAAFVCFFSFFSELAGAGAAVGACREGTERTANLAVGWTTTEGFPTTDARAAAAWAEVKEEDSEEELRVAEVGVAVEEREEAAWFFWLFLPRRLATYSPRSFKGTGTP
mmetsp:Transcript_40168/g.68348  ORF Transcript_40168/g.68348 Transcript_40168/m.68348 type:complete len:264 (+) Transcript_40168:366-1157(+)